jgi:hypothetical protein
MQLAEADDSLLVLGLLAHQGGEQSLGVVIGGFP